jgi:hypothetical protein
MSLKEYFDQAKDSSYKFSKATPFTLALTSPDYNFEYDFFQRIMTTRSRYGNVSISTLTFEQIGRDVLAFMHAKLKELKGNPPPLPEAPQPRQILKSGLGNNIE